MPDEEKPEPPAPEEKPETPAPEEKPETPAPEEVVKVEVEQQKPQTFATWTQEEKDKLYERFNQYEETRKTKEKREPKPEPKPEPEPEPEPKRRRGLRYKQRGK